MKRICPICGWTGIEFAEWAQDSYRIPRHICPICGASPRHRRARLVIQHLYQTHSIHNILHIGNCREESWLEKWCASNGVSYYTAHVSLNEGSLSVQGSPTKVLEGTYDLVYASYVLRSLPDSNKALSSIIQCMGAKALLYLEEPIEVPQQTQDKGQHKSDFIHRIERSVSLKYAFLSGSGAIVHSSKEAYNLTNAWTPSILRSLGLDEREHVTGYLFLKVPKYYLGITKSPSSSSYDLSQEIHRYNTAKVLREYLVDNLGLGESSPIERVAPGRWPIALQHVNGRKVFYVIDWDDMRIHQLLPYMDKEDILIISRAWHYSLGINEAYAVLLDLAASSPAGPAKENIIMACNYAEEADSFRSLGIRAELINHNAFLDTNLFNVRTVPKEFDAIHNANLLSYKRHELLHGVEGMRVALLAGQRDEEYIESIGGIPKCYVDLTAEGRIPEEEVVSALSRSRVGVILSAAEGGCFASNEYLYCGIPVLSCKPEEEVGSLGGREEYYNEYNSLLVEADPKEIKEGIRELSARDLDSHIIREMAISQSRPVKHHMASLVSGLVGDYDYLKMPYMRGRKLWKTSTLEELITHLKGGIDLYEDWR